MSKKNRAPHKEISAFESARAALERAGEIDAPEASGSASAQAPETGSVAPDTAESAANAAEASAVTVSAPAPEASKPDDTKSDAPASDVAPETESASDATETPVAESAPETSDDASVDASASDEAPEASKPDDTKSDAPASDVAPESSDDASVDASASEAPEASAEIVEESEAPDADAAPEASESAANPEYPDDAEPTFADGASEVEETEKHNMETREITLGRHRTAPPGSETEKASVKEPKEHSKKSPAQAFEQFKNAIRGRMESASEAAEEQAASRSSRDEAVFQRVQRMQDGETKEYLLNRILPQMTWYGRKSAQYQSKYYRFMTAAICLGALIPAFAVGANSPAVKVIIALLGASVTGINAYLALHNYHNLWLSYRATREDLIHILYCYFNRASVFSSDLLTGNPDLLLVNLCEDALSKETGGWKTIVQNVPNVGKQS